MIRRPLTSLLVLAALVAWLPCAQAKNNNADQGRKLYLAGAKALEKKDYKTAEADFTKAAGLEPANQQYQAARELIVGHRATALIEASEKARILGRAEEARSACCWPIIWTRRTR